VKWTLTQRWSGALVLLLAVIGAHVAMPSAAAAKAMALAGLAAAAVHVSASLYVVLTDYRPFAARSRGVAAVAVTLGALAALYGGSVIVRSSDDRPLPGHLPGSECKLCHTSDEHERWPLALHAPRDGKPGVDCEGCHGVAVSSPKLLATRDAETGRHVAVDRTVLLCLDCHGPRQAQQPAWPGTIHQDVKCGTCHSRVETAGEPSWKRACNKCHPREDDVHGDVKTLGTTYLSPASELDIHVLRCRSCHAVAE
jgi:hypothetical protein